MTLSARLLVLLPIVVVATNGNDHGLRAGNKQTLAVSSAGKLEVSADTLAPEGVVRRVSSRKNPNSGELKDLASQAHELIESTAVFDQQVTSAPTNTPTTSAPTTSAPTETPTNTPMVAPTKRPTALLSASSQCVTWHNFSHYIALAFGDDTVAAREWYTKKTKATLTGATETGPYAVIWFNTNTKTITQDGDQQMKYGSPSDTTFVNLCTACGLGGPDPAAVRTFCYKLLADQSSPAALAQASRSSAGGSSASRSLSLSNNGQQFAVAKDDKSSPQAENHVENEALKEATEFVKVQVTTNAPSVASSSKAETMSVAPRVVQRGTTIVADAAAAATAAAAPKAAAPKAEVQVAAAAPKAAEKQEAALRTAPKAEVKAAARLEDNAPAVKRESSTQGACADGHAACGAWAEMGECNKNPGYMHVKCKAACNMCGR